MRPFKNAGFPTYARVRKISTIFSDFPKIRARFLKILLPMCEIFLDVAKVIKYRRKPGKPVFAAEVAFRRSSPTVLKPASPTACYLV
jgi:hypothetical protein